MLQEFIREQFVSDGMCADAAIHDTDGHNPHAHILLTVRPLDEQGKWQYKTEKEYICMKNSEERGFTAAEFRTAQTDGWEKQYPYKVGKKKVYMTPSAAETQRFVRADKHPKSTRYGRQNPISERWNSEEQLVSWRAAWADVTNRYLEHAGRVERIDHRSNAARGLDEIPTIHEGVAAQALECKGIISGRCEINRQIKADNTLLRELKAEIKSSIKTHSVNEKEMTLSGNHVKGGGSYESPPLLKNWCQSSKSSNSAVLSFPCLASHPFSGHGLSSSR